MSFFNKVVGGLDAATKPAYRYGGFSSYTPGGRFVDKRTPAQFVANLKELANKNPAIADHLGDISAMGEKRLRLTSDIVELSQGTRFSGGIDFDMAKVIPQTGKSLVQHLLDVLPNAEKNNPHAIDLFQEVLDTTDKLRSKAFLAEFNGVLSDTSVAEHCRAMKPYVQEIAGLTYKPFGLMETDSYAHFNKFMSCLLGSKTKPEKVDMLKDLAKATDTSKKDRVINVFDFITNSRPTKEVKENIDILPKVLENVDREGKDIDVVEFVNKNVNLD